MNETHGPDNRSILLSQLKLGDHRAFNSIYQLYKNELALHILRMVKSEVLAEELLQDLFMNLWTHRANLDPDKSVRAYLYQSAKNLVINLLRREKKQRYIYEQIMAASTELYQHIEESIFRKENEVLLQQAIAQLSPQRRRIFVACKLEGKSYKEVAETYHISTTTVNDHIQKATQSIREYLVKKPAFLLPALLTFLLG